MDDTLVGSEIASTGSRCGSVRVVDPSYAASLHVFRKAVIAALRDVKLTQMSGGLPHEQVVPTASYAPWREDSEFLAVYEKIQGHTLVDLYRCFELWDLARQARRLPGDVLEVGVWRGGTAGLLGRGAISGTTDCRLWLADTFEGVPKGGDQDTLYRGGEHADASEVVVRELLRDLAIPQFTILRGLFPDDTASEMKNTRLKLCHIDVDVYTSAKNVFAWVWDRMVPGGLVVFDDYGIWGCEGITRLGNELKEQGVPMIYNLNGHALAYRQLEG